jgi:type IV secretion system protein TrbB
MLVPSPSTLKDTLLRLLGPEVAAALVDPAVMEVYTVAGDSCVWLDTLDRGRVRSSIELSAERAEMLLNAVASAKGRDFGVGQPILSAELPEGMGRLQGFLSPITSEAFFVLRKPAGRVIPLAELVASGFLVEKAAHLLRMAIVDRETILVVGGTATGKTTFLNSILGELASHCPSDRIGILEDTAELSCSSRDHFRLTTSPELGIDLYRLVKEALRSSPHRIVVGEVRDEAALALLDAWNTGHPGGMATLHANGCHEALIRLSTLVQRAGVPPQPQLVASTVSLLVHLVGTTRATRRVAAIARVTGFNPRTDRFTVELLHERTAP